MNLFDGDKNDTFELQRSRLVDFQLKQRDITDPDVLEAIGRVPRHAFVPSEHIDEAYADHPVAIGHGQTISQPYVVASMSQELRLNKSHRVLEVGTGCGYQTAILAELVEHVYTIECIGDLLDGAKTRLDKLGYHNVTYRCGNGTHGWPDQAPFDAILVAAAATKVPPALIEQIADPGRMVIPVGSSSFSQDLVLFVKKSGRTIKKSLYAVRFVPLQSD